MPPAYTALINTLKDIDAGDFPAGRNKDFVVTLLTGLPVLARYAGEAGIDGFPPASYEAPDDALEAILQAMHRESTALAFQLA